MAAVAVATKQPSKATQDLAELREDVRGIRYCPLAELDLRVERLALRILNAEIEARRSGRNP